MGDDVSKKYQLCLIELKRTKLQLNLATININDMTQEV